MQKEQLLQRCPETKAKPIPDIRETQTVLTENPSTEPYTALVAGAEWELVAFVTAVYELFGGDYARLSVESWMQELESTDWPPEAQSPDWRQISVRAAARAAASINPTIQNSALAGSSNEQPFDGTEP